MEHFKIFIIIFDSIFDLEEIIFEISKKKK
jgi:hypothetical protein